MNRAVDSTAVSLRNIFLPSVELRIPPYQRGYSWTLKEGADLLNDIQQAHAAKRPHFLGAVVVTCRNTRPIRSADILDGQQRLTTLTILLAVLRDLASTDAHAAIHGLIGHSWNAGDCVRASWRLNLSHIDMLFFREVVQKPGATKKYASYAAESESRENILNIVEFYHCELSKIPKDQRMKLAQFVIDMCSIVLVKILDTEMGFEVFRVLNTRGQQLCQNDILKSELFEKANLSADEANTFSITWSMYNDQLGSRGFDELLRHIHTIYEPAAQGSLLSGYRRSVLVKCPAHTFVKNVLPRYVDAFKTICGQDNDRTASPLTPPVVARINYLRLLEHGGWRAPALKYLVNTARGSADIQLFFDQLEKLAFAMQLVVVDREARGRRYRKVMEAMDEPADVFGPSSPLSLTSAEKIALMERLRGRVNSPRQRRAVALRINSALPSGEVLCPESDATLEHVLPRHPHPDSEWMRQWPLNAERRDLTDCLGNFTLLTRAENQRADRGGFADKRDVFFGSGPATYALTRDIFNIRNWTPHKVRERRDRLVLTLAGDWGLLDGSGGQQTLHTERA